MTSTADTEGLGVQIGGRTRAELLQLLRDADVRLNTHAETLLAHPAFDDTSVRELRIVQRTVEQLGLDDGAAQSRVFGAAKDQGLLPCPLVTGPYLRLALPDQANAPDSVLSAGRPPTGAINVASEPVNEDDDHPKGFYLRVVDGQSWLRGFRCDASYVWPPTQRLAFVLP